MSNFQILFEAALPLDSKDVIAVLRENAKFQRAQVIPAVLGLTQYCHQNGVAVFFVTGRPDYESLVQATNENLKKAGYSNWNKIYFHPYQQNVPHKLNSYKDIAEQGFNIILNIGDQLGDFVGDYAKHNVRLPNPFYDLSVEKQTSVLSRMKLSA